MEKIDDQLYIKSLMKKSPDLIEDNLYLGNRGHAENLVQLLELGITMII
jgi:hypothetical protein